MNIYHRKNKGGIYKIQTAQFFMGHLFDIVFVFIQENLTKIF